MLAETALASTPVGSFLVRDSESVPGGYSLSIRTEDGTKCVARDASLNCGGVL
jgi:hypothetical protein